MSLRTYARLGSSLSVLGCMFVGSLQRLSVIGCSDLASSLSMRSYCRLGSSLSALSFGHYGSVLSIRSYVRLGSSLSLSGLGKFGSCYQLSIINMCSMLGRELKQIGNGDQYVRRRFQTSVTDV